MYWFNPYFLPCVNYHAKREKKEYKLKTKLTNNNGVFSIVKPILNHNSIQLSILRVRMNTRMLWLTADVDCWMVWKKKSTFLLKEGAILKFCKKAFSKGEWMDWQSADKFCILKNISFL